MEGGAGRGEGGGGGGGSGGGRGGGEEEGGGGGEGGLVDSISGGLCVIRGPTFMLEP